MGPLPVEEYLRQACGADADALQYLLMRYHGPLRARVREVTAAWAAGRVDADDVLQEAYIAVFQHMPTMQFTGLADFYAWLEQVATNKLRDRERALRRHKRDVLREVPLVLDPAASYPQLLQRLLAAEPTPSRVVAQEEAVAAVLTSLARLPDDQRLVLRLRVIEDVSVREIAVRLGRTEQAVYALCGRALKRLRGLLGPATQYLTQM